jgi:hypothetical protein
VKSALQPQDHHDTDVAIRSVQVPKKTGAKPRPLSCLVARHRSQAGAKRGASKMGFLPRVLFALILILPGGFIVGPAVLLLKRWREHRASKQAQASMVVQPMLAAQLPREAHPIEPTRAAA